MNEIKDRNKAKVANEQENEDADGKKGYYVDIGKVSYQKELESMESGEIGDSDDDSDDNSNEELLQRVHELMNEFNPRF